ncbi:MAG: murein biosynthesis integral membrane protein MurJ [Xanthobacteraceae bacterium]
MSLARDVTTVGSATLLSRLLGFFRDVGIAALLGAGPLSDAYFAALQIPNLFRRLLAEGALNAAFVPMWLRIREQRDAADLRKFGEQAYGAMLLSLGVITVLCLVAAPIVIRLLAPGFNPTGERYNLAVEFVRLSAPYVVIAGLVAVSASVLNAENRVGAASAGIVVFNGVLVVAVLAVFTLGSGSKQAGDILSFSIVLAGLGQLLLVGGAVLRQPHLPRRVSFSFSPEVHRFFRRAIPGVVAGGIPQLKLMAGAMVASSSQASVSWLYYANRLYELPLGVASVAIASVLAPRIAASVLTSDRRNVASAQSRAFEIALALALPSAVAFAVLSTPIAGGLFQRGAFGPRDTIAVAAALTAISAGLPGHVLEKVFGAVSFAHDDTRTPMWCALAGLTLATTLSLLLFPHYGHVGIAAAIAASGWVGALLLLTILWRRGWLAVEPGIWRRLTGIVLAATIMAGVIESGDALLSPVLFANSVGRLTLLALLVSAGLAVYLATLQMLGIAKLRELLASVRERF